MTTSEITMKFSDNGNDKITLVGYNGRPLNPQVDMVTKVNNKFDAADDSTINAAVKNIISLLPANNASGVLPGGARRRTVRRRPMKKGGKKYQSKSMRRK